MYIGLRVRVLGFGVRVLEGVRVFKKVLEGFRI